MVLGGQSSSASTATQPRTTGRSLVLMRGGGEAMTAGVAALSDKAGLRSLRVADFGTFGTIRSAEIPQSTALVLDHIGVAVVNGDPDQIGRLSIQVTRSDSILAVEPERLVYAAMIPPQPGEQTIVAAAATPAPAGATRDYLVGYRDGLSRAIELGFPEVTVREPVAAPAKTSAIDESAATWGLHATKVLGSPCTGSGVKIAVLDTGFAVGHPDFRLVTLESLVGGLVGNDVHGHGTHCIGTAAGPRQPNPLPRYGIAYDAAIFAGKVLNDSGVGADGDILSGIDWAVAQGCRIISMSLSAPVARGQAASTVFENTARRALSDGTLIVAAAGNDSRRHEGYTAPVGHPANCASIMAVAAVDQNLKVAWFSGGGVDPSGGEINIAGPGVDVYSSWLMPQRYNRISGTSMATPHVAGIAALHVQANPGITAVDLWTRLVKTARRLDGPDDTGSGLVQAPE